MTRETTDQTLVQTAPLFFYGTLMDDELFACVLQAEKNRCAVAPATLPGHRVTGILGLPYPMIVPAADHSVSGIVVDGLSPEQFQRVRYYESIDYDLVPILVTRADGTAVTAHIFDGTDERVSDGRDWSIELWRQATKALSLAVMREVGPFIGKEPMEQLDERWNRVERRLIAEGMAAHKLGDVSLDAGAR